VPEHLSDEQAATLPCAAVTAWNALMEQSRLKPGDTLLVQGTGGVSLFALQFARLAGVRVIVISGSDEKLQLARRLGADALINYRSTPDWDKAAIELTDGKGVDSVVEIGGAETLSRSINAVRKGGRVSMIGLSTGLDATLFIPSVLVKQVQLQGTYVGGRSSFEQMNKAIAQTRLQPIVDRVFGFDAAHEAFRYLETGIHAGKVCIRF